MVGPTANLSGPPSLSALERERLISWNGSLWFSTKPKVTECSFVSELLRKRRFLSHPGYHVSRGVCVCILVCYPAVAPCLRDSAATLRIHGVHRVRHTW